jgi:hypothetical protein
MVPKCQPDEQNFVEGIDKQKDVEHRRQGWGEMRGGGE